jgi:hypothetical protein
MSRIHCQKNDVSIFNEQEDWKKMFAFMVDVVPRFERAFKKPIQELSRR